MPGIPVQSPVDNRGFHVKQLLGSGFSGERLGRSGGSAVLSNRFLAHRHGDYPLECLPSVSRRGADLKNTLHYPEFRTIQGNRLPSFIFKEPG